MRHLAAWRGAPFHYPSNFICRKSAERSHRRPDWLSQHSWPQCMAITSVPCQLQLNPHLNMIKSAFRKFAMHYFTDIAYKEIITLFMILHSVRQSSRMWR